MNQLVSRHRAQSLGLALFFLGLAIVSFADAWWPWIMLVIGIPISFRQLLLGRYYDAFVTLVVFLGIFGAYSFPLNKEYILPIVFLVSALFILVREFSEGYRHQEDEEEEDINHEIEEESNED